MLEIKPCFWFQCNLCLQVIYFNALFLVSGSYSSLRMVGLELFTFYFCCLAWCLLTAIDTLKPLYSETSDEALHLYLLCSVDHLRGSCSRAAVTWHMPLNIALGAPRKIYYFTSLSNPFSPSKFTIKWVCYDSELQRNPCWWHCIDYCILILHVFSQSFLLFLIYISFLAAVFFSLLFYCRIRIFTPWRWWGCLCTQ